MSKFKINDKVIVKENGMVGTIKGRDQIALPDGKVRVEYIVKTGEGFDNWNKYSKHEIAKVGKDEINKPLPTMVIDAPNGYKVTLIALVHSETVWKDDWDKNGFYSPYRRKGKELSMGYAIYNPNDEYDPVMGISIAKHRAKVSPFCHLVSDFNGEFNRETIDALLKVKGRYIANNIENFVRSK